MSFLLRAALLPAACALSAGVFSGGVSPAVAAPYGPLNPNFDAGMIGPHRVVRFDC
ncbi:hypothetical protein KC8_05200 [Sphingomonas sp. KC8]|nr:hypothetical protein KC8_05200 [Sphingomonas sp. KC8]